MYHFRVDPDHDPVTDILKGIFAIVGQEQYEFCENFLINFLRGHVSLATNCSTLMLIEIRIQIQEFLTELFCHCAIDRGNCKNFVGSAALREISGLSSASISKLFNILPHAVIGF